MVGGYVPNYDGSGSRRPKNLCFRIHNTGPNKTERSHTFSHLYLRNVMVNSVFLSNLFLNCKTEDSFRFDTFRFQLSAFLVRPTFYFPVVKPFGRAGRKILHRISFSTVHLDPEDLLKLHEIIQILTALQADPRSVHPLMQSIVTGVRTNDLFSALKVNQSHVK
jgi:hypothetical protein